MLNYLRQDGRPTDFWIGERVAGWWMGNTGSSCGTPLKSSRPPTTSAVNADMVEGKPGYLAQCCLSAESTPVSWQCPFSVLMTSIETCALVWQWSVQICWSEMYGARCMGVLGRLALPGLLRKIASQRGKQVLCSVCVNTVWPWMRERYVLDDLTLLLSHVTSHVVSQSLDPRDWETTWVGQLNVSRCICLSVLLVYQNIKIVNKQMCIVEFETFW